MPVCRNLSISFKFSSLVTWKKLKYILVIFLGFFGSCFNVSIFTSNYIDVDLFPLFNYLKVFQSLYLFKEPTFWFTIFLIYSLLVCISLISAIIWLFLPIYCFGFQFVLIFTKAVRCIINFLMWDFSFFWYSNIVA